MTINHCKLRDVTSTPCLHPNNVVPPKKRTKKKTKIFLSRKEAAERRQDIQQPSKIECNFDVDEKMR